MADELFNITLSQYSAAHAPFLRLASQARRMSLSIPTLRQWRVSAAVSLVLPPSMDDRLLYAFRPKSSCYGENKRTYCRNECDVCNYFFFLHLFSGYAIFIIALGFREAFASLIPGWLPSRLVQQNQRRCKVYDCCYKRLVFLQPFEHIHQPSFHVLLYRFFLILSTHNQNIFIKFERKHFGAFALFILLHEQRG